MRKISVDIRQRLINYILDMEDDYDGIDQSRWREAKEHGIIGYQQYEDQDLIDLAENYLDHDNPTYAEAAELINEATACLKVDEIINGN